MTMLVKLNALPERMITAHHFHNLAEYVLHELCDSSCLSLHKAAFLLDNPEFDALCGIAGVHHQERFAAPSPADSIWQCADQFTEHMAQCRFNTAVRAIQRKSIQRQKKEWGACAAELADEMVFERGRWDWLTFAAKHGNTGLLIFEPALDRAPLHKELLVGGASLLGFCPVF